MNKLPKIPQNAKIADILDRLNNPEEYVRQVVGNMTPVHRRHGSAVVRIGLTGTGFSPHYRVDPGDSFMALVAKTGLLEGNEPGPDADEYYEEHFVAYHGRNHEKLCWDSKTLRGEHWSTDQMTYEEVRELLGSLRDSKRPRRSS